MPDGSKQLIVHIVTHYKKHFEVLSYVSVFDALLLKYEQGHENLSEANNVSDQSMQPITKDGWGKIDERDRKSVV